MTENVSAQVSWLDREIQRFKERGILIPPRQEKLYQKIRDHWVSGRTVMDVGCSLGVGSNILSHYARFVWGVDVNEEAVRFASLAFKRPNLDFALLDIEKQPTKELARFEIVVVSEVLEHLAEPEAGLQVLKGFFSPKLLTVGFITCPNQNNEEVRENEAKHGFHISHWTAGEFYELMTKHFSSVVLYSVDKLESWNVEETVDGNSTDYLLVAKVEGPK